MGIHQISVTYQADQDRLLVRLRTHAAERIELWLTRRMMMRLWTPLQQSADRVCLRSASPGSTVLPEAQDMMNRAARDKSRQSADFESAFDESFTSRPLGDQPMLVHAVDMQEKGQGQPLMLKFRDAAHREMTLDVGNDLFLNLLGLIEQALEQAEWGWTKTKPATQQVGSAPTPQRILN